MDDYHIIRQQQQIQILGKNFIVIDKYMYTSTDLLGEGSFGKVYRGFSVPGQGKEMEYAIKTMELPDNLQFITEKDQMTVDTIRKEIVALKMLRHNNIIRLYEVKKIQNIIFLIMELCNQGSLSDFVKKNQITELEIRYYFSQILDGFQYLLKKQITHRDIKPENILIRNGIMKIADFGFAKQQNMKNNMHSYLGTRATISPQVIMGNYTNKCDIWSLGATLYFLCFREYPFKGFYGSEVKLMEIMKKEKINFPKSGMDVSPQLKQLIISMLRFNESDRIDWGDLFQCPLFKQNLLLEVGLNVFIVQHNDDDMDDDDQNIQKSQDLSVSKIIYQVDIEFELNVRDKSQDELRNVQQQAIEHLDKIDIKRKCSVMLQQLINRITFEKGKANLLKQMAKKVHDYELQLSSRTIFNNTRVDIADHLKALRFGLNKFELMILRGMLNWTKLEQTKQKIIKMQSININILRSNYYFSFEGTNPINVDELDWKLFFNNNDNELICKQLEKEIAIQKQFVFNVSWKSINQIYNINKKSLSRLNIDDNFVSDNLHCDKEFFITLYNICVKTAKLLFPEIIRVKNKQDEIYKIIPTLTLIDDLLILLTLETIFKYDDNQQINFNVFMDSRSKQYSENPDIYHSMFSRVLRTYEIFFE